MSHSKFYSSLLLLIVLNAIIKPIWIFGIDRQVQNIIGGVEYGTYFSLLNLSIVFSFLLDWGVTNFINRELAANEKKIRSQLGSFFLLKILFAFFYVLVVFFVAFITKVKRWDIVWAVVIIQFLTFLFVFLRSIVTASQWFKTDAWLSVLDKTFMIIICSGFIFWPVVFGKMNLHAFLWAQITCTLLVVLITIFILMNRGIAFKKPNLHFLDRSVLNSVLPFALTVFLMSMHIRLDGFLLERLHPQGAHEAGIYAAAYRLLDASNIIGYLIASFMLPFIARLWSEKKSLDEIVLQGRHLQVMFAITIISIIIMLAPWLQKILYHNNETYNALVMQWCLSSLAGYALVQVYGTVLTATGNIVSFCYLNLGAVILNILLNLVLISRLGAWGCCIAALCSQLILGMSCMIFVHKKFQIKFHFASLVMYVLNGFGICAALYFISKTSINTIFLLPVAAVITLTVMWSTKMISLNNWLNFLKKQ